MTFDVVVVGAGPAGSTATKFLAEQGVKVLLLDKSRFPRDKPCGGVLSLRTLKRFPYISQDLISAYSYDCKISSGSLKNSFQVKMDEPISAFVIRKDFDHGLVNYAKASGAVVREGASVSDLKILKDKTLLSLETGEHIESQLVIGADGVWSIIAKKSGLGNHYPNIGRCLFQEIPLSPDLLDEYFTEKRKASLFVKFMGVDGFGWVVPKKNCLNIGIGEIQPTPRQRQHKHSLKEVYHRYIDVLKERRIIPQTITSEMMQGGSLPIQPFKKTFANRVLLCGDAAGQMNPLTGDGIHYAMSAGMFAANACKKALDASQLDAAFLSTYQKQWKKDFGYEMKIFHFVLNALLKKNRDEKYVRLLSKDPHIFGMLFSMANMQGRIQDYQWTIARRFGTVYIKDLLGL